MSQVKPGLTGQAILRLSYFGPVFGNDVFIDADSNRNATSGARLGYYYSVPPAVQNNHTVLAGTLFFSPDEVEVFYLNPSR